MLRGERDAGVLWDSIWRVMLLPLNRATGLVSGAWGAGDRQVVPARRKPEPWPRTMGNGQGAGAGSLGSPAVANTPGISFHYRLCAAGGALRVVPTYTAPRTLRMPGIVPNRAVNVKFQRQTAELVPGHLSYRTGERGC